VTHLRNGVLAKLRGRDWRLAALVLWAALLLVNLGASFEHASFPADPEICTELGHSAAPAPAQDHAAGPHCPLCYVVSAGVLAPPSGAQVLVLAPPLGWAELRAELLSAPIAEFSHQGPLARAPPAFV